MTTESLGFGLPCSNTSFIPSFGDYAMKKLAKVAIILLTFIIPAVVVVLALSEVLVNHDMNPEIRNMVIIFLLALEILVIGTFMLMMTNVNKAWIAFREALGFTNTDESREGLWKYRLTQGCVSFFFFTKTCFFLFSCIILAVSSQFLASFVLGLRVYDFSHTNAQNTSFFNFFLWQPIEILRLLPM